MVAVPSLITWNSYPKAGVLKGQCHKIFCLSFFSWITFPQAPDNNIRIISNFFENSRRYSQVKVHHRYQRHRRQILPPVPLVLLTPVANNWNNIRLQIPESELEGKNLYICFLYYPKVSKFFWLKIFSICHRCRWHRWQTLSCEYLREFSKKFDTALKV